jgi:hypothetical protein
MVTTFCISVICQINFGKGLKKYRIFQFCKANAVVVRKEKETYVSYDYNNDEMDYQLAPVPQKGPRVVLD